MSKLKVGVKPEPEFELPDGYPVEEDQLGLDRFFYRREFMPTEWWELVELACAGCPTVPLKAFRKTIIGRGKPLDAARADSAIKGALKSMGFHLDAKGDPAKDRKTGTVIPPKEYPESIDVRLVRARWYIKTDRTVIFARPQSHHYNEEEKRVIRAAQEAGVPRSFLEWDDGGVDRVAGPAFALQLPFVPPGESV